MDHVMQGLDGWAESQAASRASAGDAVLGLGGCLDYEVTWDSTVLEELAREHAITASDLDLGTVIGTERELVCSILAFMRDGVGGERAVASLDTIEAVSARFPRRVALGGTSVRAAVAMSRIGVPSTLHLVSVDDTVRDLLPDDVEFVCSGEGDTLNPHLIVQFPRGASVRLSDGVVTAPRANRLIYVCDQPNTLMRIDSRLPEMLAAARLFLISGFNAMVSEQDLRQRIRAMRDAIATMAPESLVVFEDAGYHLPELSAVFIDGMADAIDVYGMNEDELSSHVGRPVDLRDAADVARALDHLARKVSGPTIVVHTSAWALAYGEAAERLAPALEGGIDLAATRYGVGDALDAHAVSRTRERPHQADGERFAREIERLLPGRVVCRAARDVATDNPTTIGLGDTFVGGFVAALVAES